MNWAAAEQPPLLVPFSRILPQKPHEPQGGETCERHLGDAHVSLTRAWADLSLEGAQWHAPPAFRAGRWLAVAITRVT